MNPKTQQPSQPSACKKLLFGNLWVKTNSNPRGWKKNINKKPWFCESSLFHTSTSPRVKQTFFFLWKPWKPRNIFAHRRDAAPTAAKVSEQRRVESQRLTEGLGVAWVPRRKRSASGSGLGEVVFSFGFLFLVKETGKVFEEMRVLARFEASAVKMKWSTLKAARRQWKNIKETTARYPKLPKQMDILPKTTNHPEKKLCFFPFHQKNPQKKKTKPNKNLSFKHSLLEQHTKQNFFPKDFCWKMRFMCPQEPWMDSAWKLVWRLVLCSFWPSGRLFRGLVTWIFTRASERLFQQQAAGSVLWHGGFTMP